MSDLECANCKNTNQAKFTGLEIQGFYDCICAWKCLECRHIWPSNERFEKHMDKIRDIFKDD